MRGRGPPPRQCNGRGGSLRCRYHADALARTGLRRTTGTTGKEERRGGGEPYTRARVHPSAHTARAREGVRLSNQKQSGGAESQFLQAGRDIVIRGLSAADV